MYKKYKIVCFFGAVVFQRNENCIKICVNNWEIIPWPMIPYYGVFILTHCNPYKEPLSVIIYLLDNNKTSIIFSTVV